MSALDDLAALCGITRSWHDLNGTHHWAGPETVTALLSAMGLSASSEAEATVELARLRQAGEGRVLPAEWIVEPFAPVTPPAPWVLTLEDGGEIEGGAGESFAPPMGLHRLHCAGRDSLIIAAPPRAPEAPRGWGFTLPLYGLVSARNLGVGDFADLGAAAAALGGLGADFLGVNPVHARGALSRDISPYAPSSRIALDPGFIALDAVPGAAQMPPAPPGPMADHAGRDARLYPALRAALAGQPAPEAPEALRRFALFEAISATHGPDWQGWPDGLGDPDGAAARAFGTAAAAEVAFHLHLQHIAATQLGAAQARAKAAGMRLGLYLDIAVGVRPDGADVWANPAAFARGVSLGAPPDAFSADGQRWNLAPFAPHGLRAADYQPFRDMLRASMAHAGLVRIDHILGFRRAYWLPDNGAPGAYVDYPLDTLLALTRIEATRAGCVVVGEDLGTVPDGLREALGRSAILGCAVTQFERDHGNFIAPRHYRDGTLASLATHDTPTMRGWWQGRDVDWRGRIGRLKGQEIGWAQDHRAWERGCLAAMLGGEGLGVESEDQAMTALTGALATAGSRLVAVQVEDALGAVEQQNMPGTVTEHPNWCRRLDVAVEAMGTDPRLAATAAILNNSRPRAAEGKP